MTRSFEAGDEGQSSHTVLQRSHGSWDVSPAGGLGLSYRRAGPRSRSLVSPHCVMGRAGAGSKAELTFLEGVGIPGKRSLSPACSQLTISSPLRPPGLFIASHPKHKLLFAAFPRPRPRLCFKSDFHLRQPRSRGRLPDGASRTMAGWVTAEPAHPGARPGHHRPHADGAEGDSPGCLRRVQPPSRARPLVRGAPQSRHDGQAPRSYADGSILRDVFLG